MGAQEELAQIENLRNRLLKIRTNPDWFHRSVLPASARSPLAVTTPERRETVRFAVTARIEVCAVDTNVELTLIDLSMGGFSATSNERIPAGGTTEFRFATPNGAWAVTLHAQSVYSADGSSGAAPVFLCGFRFLNPEQLDVQARIYSLVDHATSVVTFS